MPFHADSLPGNDGDVTFNLQKLGDLTVSGTTTTINTTNLEVQDKLIAINHGGR